MKTDPNYKLRFEDVKELLKNLAEQRSLDSILNLIVDRLASGSQTALARIWLIKPGRYCDSWLTVPDCPEEGRCLHLQASKGKPLDFPEQNRRDDEGKYKQMPFGANKVMEIAKTGVHVEISDLLKNMNWLYGPEWAVKEKVLSFAGIPLIFKGEILGVLTVFTRFYLTKENFFWLKVLVDHASAAIVNSRAFEEIEELKSKLEIENATLKEEVKDIQAFGDLIGRSSALENTLEQIDLVAPTDASVLIYGESGTGKELVAREIHQRSSRKEKPIVKVNCASIPKELYESEFFGHVKGSFTGALKDRAGRFEIAHGGTLFLDEIGEIPIELQSKLLRVLQEGEYERVGEEKTRKVDVRIIAATNRDLNKEIEHGRFRQDLYYRLNVFNIEIAPLRRRKEDIPDLARHFLQKAANKMNRPIPRLTRSKIYELQEYDWPGNIRELQNILERALILSRSRNLQFDLPANGKPTTIAPEEHESVPPATNELEIITDREMKRLEQNNIVAALSWADWKIYGNGGAAELLGMKPTTLSSKIKKMGIEKPR